MFRDIMTLIEHTTDFPRVWVCTTKEHAANLIASGPSLTEGDYGCGFYVDGDPFDIGDDEDHVVLEYRVKDHTHILNLDDHPHEWHRYEHYIDNPNMWKLLVKDGIDAIHTEDCICFYNVHSLIFSKVYSGVVDDPLEETDTNMLDEFALGGLQRCTAVTVNALLKDFKLTPITLRDVPVDHPGVLRILAAKGLSYKPVSFGGNTVQQFVNTHALYDWYLLTPGHAMALIRGELFDAENKGPDERKLQAVFQVSRR